MTTPLNALSVARSCWLQAWPTSPAESEMFWTWSCECGLDDDLGADSMATALTAAIRAHEEAAK